MKIMSDFEQEEHDGIEIVLDIDEPSSQRMIIIKVLECGDIHAEDNDGQMIIARTDGTIQTFLHGDTNWVRGRLSNFNQAWEVIGFHLGMTDGFNVERTRNETTN
jgi:hypothetical protein